MKIGIIGDMHMKEALGYADYVKDRRIPEKKEILDFIVRSFSECDGIVFLGDQLDARNNPSSVVREFTEFLERFDGKKIYIIAGNHEIKGDGTTAIDYLAEIKKPNWNIINKQGIVTVDGMTFCPYILKSTVDAKTDQEAAEKIMQKLEEVGEGILFAHHAFKGSSVNSGQTVDLFPEPVLDYQRLEKKFKRIVGGHIHKPQQIGKLLVAGSIFNNEVGESGKNVYILNTVDGDYKTIGLPGRGLKKLINPTYRDLSLPLHCIVKVIVDDKSIDVAELRKELQKFDAYLLLEQYKNERAKAHFDEGAIDLSIDKLLEMYATDRKIDINKLKIGFDLIK